MQLHVAGALELFVDDLVHATARVEQAGGDNGERPTFLKVAGCADESLGRVERGRVYSTG